MNNADIAVYKKYQDEFKPRNRIEVLLIGESPPDPGRGELRYFYKPEYTPPDNLIKGVATAAYPTTIDVSMGENKKKVLQWLQDNGYWLIDAVEYPINKYPDQERRNLIRGRRGELAAYCKELSPKRGVIICHERVFCLLAVPLCEAGLIILQDECLPFPIGNGVDPFVKGVRVALGIQP